MNAPLRRLSRGLIRALRARPGVVAAVAAAVVAVDVLLPPLVLAAARGPWTFFTFNPWLKRLPEYLASPRPWGEKLSFVWGAALFWFSADGPYGAPEWGFAVSTDDLARFLATGLLVGVYVALLLEYRRTRAAVPARRAAGGGATLGAWASVLGLSTGPCSVVGCGAPVLPVVGLVFTGLSSTTLTLMSTLSRWSALAVLAALVLAIAWLAWHTGPPAPRPSPSTPSR